MVIMSLRIRFILITNYLSLSIVAFTYIYIVIILFIQKAHVFFNSFFFFLFRNLFITHFYDAIEALTFPSS